MKKRNAWGLSRNHPLIEFDVMLEYDWPVEQCFLHIRVFFGGKTKRPCVDLFIHWLIKQIKKTCRNHFPRSYKNCSIKNDCSFPRQELYLMDIVFFFFFSRIVSINHHLYTCNAQSGMFSYSLLHFELVL